MIIKYKGMYCYIHANFQAHGFLWGGKKDVLLDHNLDRELQVVLQLETLCFLENYCKS